MRIDFANPDFVDIEIPGTYAACDYIFAIADSGRGRMVRKIDKFSYLPRIFEARGYRFSAFSEYRRRSSRRLA